MSTQRKALSPDQAAALVPDGATVMIGGFLGVGSPRRVIDALVARGAKGLTVIGNDTGRPELGILTRHILPACVPTLIVQAAIFCAQNMLMGASLSFLGLGAQPPSPELGAMLGAGRQYLRVAPQVVAVPAVGIFLGVLAFNFLSSQADGLSLALDQARGQLVDALESGSTVSLTNGSHALELPATGVATRDGEGHVQANA